MEHLSKSEAAATREPVTAMRLVDIAAPSSIVRIEDAGP